MNAIFCLYNRNIVGIDGKLPSQVIPDLGAQPAVKADMKIFKHVTKDAIVVMGRATWDSLDRKPLPGRKMNIVITSDPEKLAKENPIYRYKDPVNYLTKEQFDKWYKKSSDNIWIIGGVQLLKEYIPLCEQVYVNELHCKGKFKEINNVSVDRCTSFYMHDFLNILKESGFPTYNQYADGCEFIREDVTLYTYRFVKDYRIGWNL